VSAGIQIATMVQMEMPQRITSATDARTDRRHLESLSQKKEASCLLAKVPACLLNRHFDDDNGLSLNQGEKPCGPFDSSFQRVCC
jgi:hypothetical protein